MTQYRDQGLQTKILPTMWNSYHGYCYFKEVFEIQVPMMCQRAVKKPAA